MLNLKRFRDCLRMCTKRVKTVISQFRRQVEVVGGQQEEQANSWSVAVKSAGPRSTVTGSRKTSSY